MFKKNMVLSILLTVPALALILNIATGAAGAAGDDPAEIPKDAGYTDVPLEKLAAEFTEIRKIKGHFDGGKWNAEVDRWQGRKHRLMMELEIRLAKGKYQKSDIIRLLQPPDQIARCGDVLFKWITELPGNNTITSAPVEYLLYYWRGTHDFLYFTCIDDAIVRSGWWYAWE